MKTLIIENSQNINGLIVLKPDSYYDYRGENIQTYDENEYNKLINNIKFSTDSYSFSTRNVLRGFHGDTESWKLVQCLRGTIYFSVIDVRPNATKFNPVFTTTLSDRNRLQVLIPKGCVNAHLCMSDDCIFSYKLSNGYVPVEKQLHIKWNDKKYLKYIKWPITNPILSPRDTQ
jgi:dTDP-4-dehydrorhamnose 3,5-epimerase